MAGNITIEYNERDILELILNDLARKMPNVNFKETDVQILVKSKQNYKSEWERAEFRAKVNSFGSLREDEK